MSNVVLSLCDKTGNMVAPWAEAGYRCYCVDIQHPPGVTELAPNVFAVGADLRTWDASELPESPVIVFAFPPCTHLAGSGARWWAQKGDAALQEGLELVRLCRETAERFDCPWMLENPVGRLATHWRKADFMFDPCDYGGYLTPAGEAYRKRTCLWTGGGFKMPAPKPVKPEGRRPGQPNAWYSKVGGKSQATKNYRSQTARGFARAVWEANRPQSFSP